jgi:hypothetical protein
LGKVAEACRQRGLDPTSFYEWKLRSQTKGFEGLKDMPSIHKSHPQTTPPATVERIRALVLEHLAYGCNRLKALLRLEGVALSAITIQQILNAADLGARTNRRLALEKTNRTRRLEITPEQATFIEKLNRRFRQRYVERSAPGELRSADTSRSSITRASARFICMPLSTLMAPRLSKQGRRRSKLS